MITVTREESDPPWDQLRMKFTPLLVPKMSAICNKLWWWLIPMVVMAVLTACSGSGATTLEETKTFVTQDPAPTFDPAEDMPTDLIRFYLIIPENNGQSGPLVGCGDSAVAVWRDRVRTGSLRGDIQASLDELFSIKTMMYGKSGYIHSLYDSDLRVQHVTVEDNTAVIELTGALQLIGTCGDARMEAQIQLTVFQYSGFDSALITVNGVNLKVLFDVSGTIGDDEPYLR